MLSVSFRLVSRQTPEARERVRAGPREVRRREVLSACAQNRGSRLRGPLALRF